VKSQSTILWPAEPYSNLDSLLFISRSSTRMGLGSIQQYVLCFLGAKVLTYMAQHDTVPLPVDLLARCSEAKLR
jgi:hypothetical protein